MTSVFVNAFEQMLLFLPICFGMYITYRVMNITDLTVQATFVLGAGVFARLISAHYGEAVATCAAFGAGAITGCVVAAMQKYAKLDALITSILAIFMLYSINFEVMGRPNISLLSTSTLLQSLQVHSGAELMLLLAIIMIAIVGALFLLMKSRVGLMLRAFSNSMLLRSLAKNRFLLLMLGLALSNGLAAVSGLITAQVNGYADINMGLGVALTAIGAMILGISFVDQFRGKTAVFNYTIESAATVLGVFVYFVFLNMLLYFGVNPILLKLVLGAALLVFLSGGRFHSREVSYV